MKQEEIKKLLERWYLDRFIESFESFPRGEIIADEEPDFLIRNKKDSIGIELTNFYLDQNADGTSLQAQESLRKRTAMKARQFYDDAGGNNLCVTLYFRHNSIIRKNRINNLAKEISDLVLSVEPQIVKSFSIRNSWDYNDLPEEIISIHIFRFDNLKENFWTPISSGFPEDCSAEMIQNIIDKKNMRIESYHRKCPIVWLIIIAEGSGLSSTAEIPAEIFKHKYNIKFDRVFFFQNFEQNIVELSIDSIDP